MKVFLFLICLGFVVPSAFCEEYESAPAIVESNEDGSSNLQQGQERITTDADGNTVITDGKDSLVFRGSAKNKQAPSTGNIVIDDPAGNKHIKMDNQGIVIEKNGTTVRLGQ